MLRNIFQKTLVMLLLAVLLGCQYLPNESLFQFGPKDSEITASVHQALESNPNLAPFTFHIETVDRIVYLSGYVKTIRQSDNAELLASRVSGVKAVENNIIVRK